MIFPSLRAVGYSPLLTLVLALFLLTSCRSAFLGPVERSVRLLDAGRAAIKNPLGSVDHVRLAGKRAAMSFVQDRVRPASTVIGKKFLTLDDCRNVALANNLDIRVSRMDERTKAAIKRAQLKRLLPHMLFTGELSERDTQRFSFSEVLGDEGIGASVAGVGFGVNRYSSGKERSTWRYAAELNWSPNEAAQVFYDARNSRGDRLSSHYQTIRKAQEVLGRVDAAFFRLLAIQKYLPLASRVASLRSAVVRKKMALHREKLIGIEQLNDAKEKEIRARLVLSRSRNEGERQRNILASTIGLSPDYSIDGGFQVIGELSRPRKLPRLCEQAIWDLERQGVQNRPETFRATLDYLKAHNEVKKTYIRYLPDIKAFWRYTRDKDKFLYERDWKDVGVNIRVDLLDLLANADAVIAAESNRDMTDSAFDSIARGVVAQVRDAALKYFDALASLRSNAAFLRNAQDYLRITGRRSARGELDKVSVEEAQADLTAKRAEALRLLGEANAALADLGTAMATNYNEPLPVD